MPRVRPRGTHIAERRATFGTLRVPSILLRSHLGINKYATNSAELLLAIEQAERPRSKARFTSASATTLATLPPVSPPAESLGLGIRKSPPPVQI